MRKLVRILCLALCLALLCSAALAADYTLPEKMNRQISFGSGVKGAMTIAVAGGAEWLDLLLPFTGSELQIRYIVSGDQFQLQLYATDDQEQQRALTQAYGDDTHLYLRSELLPDTLLTLPLGSSLMDMVFGSDQKNPTFYTVVQELLNIPSDDWENKWAPVLEPYEAALETWLQQYAAEPSITQSASGSSNMTLRYDIPAEGLKAAMKELMGQFLRDTALMELLRPLVSSTQQAVYLNPTIGYFYDAAIDALPITDSLTMTRVMTTRGQMISSELVMPLPENGNGWDSLALTLAGPETALTLNGVEQSITLALDETSSEGDNAAWKGFFRCLPAEGTPVSAAFTLQKTFNKTTDMEDSRAHETTTWSLTAEPDLSHLEADDPVRAEYADFDVITVNFSTHYSGRALDNNPTTLELSLSAQLPAVAIEAQAALRTTTPWVLSSLPTEGAESLLTMPGERAAELLQVFATNAALTMTSLTSAVTAEPEASAEPTLVPPAQ